MPSLPYRSGVIALFALQPFLMPQSALAQEISPQAQAQIQALMHEKATRGPVLEKLSSSLAVALRSRATPELLASMPALRQSIDTEGTVTVDLSAQVSEPLLEDIERLGGNIVNAHPRFDAVRAEVPWQALQEVASRGDVRWIREAAAHMTHRHRVRGAESEQARAQKARAQKARAQKNAAHGGNVTEGDVAHNASSARVDFGVDGAGVRVGVMSDSVDSLASLVSSGDLPAGVTVLAGQSGNPGLSEGTALLEIVHDLAPGADLFFATGKGGPAQMAQNILDLAAAGCDVIVDDIFYFAEGVFQDGVIAQAVETVSAAGVLFFSSAGNAGNLQSGTSGVWEGDYQATTLPGPLDGLGLSAHDFGGDDTGNEIFEDALNDAPFFTLQWSEPLGAADTDLDLFLLDATGTNVVKFSTDVQDGTQDPFETINSVGEDDSGNLLVVVLAAGSPPFIHLNTHRARLEHGTDGQIFGHPAAESAFAVAAVDVGTAGGGPFTGGPANPVETFSSDGPRRIFFTPDGSPVEATSPSSQGAASAETLGEPGVRRKKPNLTAANRVTTATPGFEFFAGTSASAPHAAGLAALLLENAPSTTNASLRNNLRQTSLDIEDEGCDLVSGDGIPLADALLEKSMPGVSTFQSNDPVQTSESPGSAPDTIQYVLDAEPSADVSIGFSIDDSSEATLAPDTLTFTASTWDQPQTVMISGEDDDIDDGDVDFNVVPTPTMSADTNYADLEVPTVSGQNADDDTANVSIDPMTVTTDETGTTDTFTVVLDSEPIFDVTLDVGSDDTTEGLVSDNEGGPFSEQISLTFSPTDWDKPQTVFVQGQDDDIFFAKAGIDGNVVYEIRVTGIDSQDPIYSNLDTTGLVVTATNLDGAFFDANFETGDFSEWSQAMP